MDEKKIISNIDSHVSDYFKAYTEGIEIQGYLIALLDYDLITGKEYDILQKLYEVKLKHHKEHWKEITLSNMDKWK